MSYPNTQKEWFNEFKIESITLINIWNDNIKTSTKDYNPLKQSKHIGFLIHDFTHMLIELCASNYA